MAKEIIGEIRSGPLRRGSPGLFSERHEVEEGFTVRSTKEEG